MESIFAYICEQAHHAHWILFLLLLLAGFNVPLSEDVILLTGGALASTCISDHTMRMYLWLYFGCWISAWEAFWIGRLLGPKLYTWRWFSRVITPKRIQRLHHYYEKFGIFTFILGRFIPGGVRNALFITSGLGGMRFSTFILRDGLACLLSSSLIFYIGYKFGENHQLIIHYFRRYELIVGLLLFSALTLILVIFWKKGLLFSSHK
jgi:membrane-associated protein